MITFAEGEAKQLNLQLAPLVVIPETASLFGTVTDVDTGGGIQGVAVEIIGVGSTTTNANGYYTISDITPGSYTVRFSHPDYETLEM